MNKGKSFEIARKAVLEAYKLVKANQGAAGVDNISIEMYEVDLKNNLYKLWNRMSSGSYFPSPVLGVEIPKKNGGTRLLGIPTVEDRIAQMVVKLNFEHLVEDVFYPDSYGYRPNKSAIDAVSVTRKRCWETNWVISPVHANLFMHYAFDSWISRTFPDNKWARYADDGVIHCKSENEANVILSNLKLRMIECNLEIHQDKTKIIYCKDSKRKLKHTNTSFDFLGYTFRARLVGCKNGSMFISFTPAVSLKASQNIRDKIRSWKLHWKTSADIEVLARIINPVVRGWINYYGQFHKSLLYDLLQHVNRAIIQWVKRKYKRFFRKTTRAYKWLAKVASYQPKLFYHWEVGILPAT